MANMVLVAVADVVYPVDRPYTYAVPEELARDAVSGKRVLVPFGGNRLREGLILSAAVEYKGEVKAVHSVLDEEPILSEQGIKLALWMRKRFFCTIMEAVHAMLPTAVLYRIKSTYEASPGVDRGKAYAAAGSSAMERLVLDCVFSHDGPCPLEDIEAVAGDKNPGAALRSLEKKNILRAGASAKSRAGSKTVTTVGLTEAPEELLKKIPKNAFRQASVIRVVAQIPKGTPADICYFSGAGRDTIKKLVDKGFLCLEKQTVLRRPDYSREPLRPLPELNAAQSKVAEGILRLAGGDKPQAALLHGVTGSGKTAVYVHLIHEMLKRGKASILLVPEISLTPQMLKTFSSYFGDKIAVLHSSLSVGERYDEWQRLRTGQAKIAIGTRSAVFAPVEPLGLVIIDEEQEHTYKSENSPRYHAVDVAKYRCACENALVLLGSATPDITSSFYARSGRYRLFSLPERYNKMQLPEVKIADMKQELRRGNAGSISSLLAAELQRNLQNGEQSILFINRRGTNSMVSCGECGFVYKCPHCTAYLTYHSRINRLICHYCGYKQPPGAACPECGGILAYHGAGTQKIVEELGQLFPDAPVLRMDADSVTQTCSHRLLLERFRYEKIPLMVGTQMITKGLNFENVTLVGVVDADQGLYAGDYRSAERAFSLITQVIGRSGRYEKPGRAVIQTFTPQNSVIEYASRQDYEAFYREEIQLRELSFSPPFSEVFCVSVHGPSENEVITAAGDIRQRLVYSLKSAENVRVLGPAPYTVSKVNNIWRYRVTVMAEKGALVRSVTEGLLLDTALRRQYPGVSFFADYNPLD